METTGTKNDGLKLKVYGEWGDSLTDRLKIALKLKRLEFEYVEEDPVNKSSSILLYNPVYNQVPILLHHGRPVLDSVNIIQYVDEILPDNYPIMPTEAYERAVVRYWCHFADHKLGPSVEMAFRSWGDDLVEAVKKVHDQLNFLECELREGFFKGRRFYGGEKIGMLDIVIGSGSHWLSAFDEVAKINLIEPKSFPLFSAWLGDFTEQDVVKDTVPDRLKLLEYISGFRSMMFKSTGPLLINDSSDNNTKGKDEGNRGSDNNNKENGDQEQV